MLKYTRLGITNNLGHYSLSLNLSISDMRFFRISKVRSPRNYGELIVTLMPHVTAHCRAVHQLALSTQVSATEVTERNLIYGLLHTWEG